jgi:15-cis-phytoene synthase
MRSEATALAIAPRADDLRACRVILARGSKSFTLASRLLPERVRTPAAIVYAFCREADDAVDLGEEPTQAVASLRDRLDRIYAGSPAPEAVDRALAQVVSRHEIPRALFDALLEGFAWDAEARRYPTLHDLLEYCARVASVVGVLMTIIMGCRSREVLARACDLGAAMQLTNVARDVGEDARHGRIYLPMAWMREAGIEPRTWVRAPTYDVGLAEVVARVLEHADGLYRRAQAGVAALPSDCRTAIGAAALIYADIGRVIRARDHDSVSTRARVGPVRKLMLLLRARWSVQAAATSPLEAEPLEETRFLIDAVCAS